YVHARRTGFDTGVEYNLLQKDDLMSDPWIDLGDSAIVGVAEYGDDYDLVTNRVETTGSKTFLNLEVAEDGAARYDGSPDRLTVALIGDPQYGFPSGTDPQPALDDARLTFEDLKTVPHDFFVVLGDLIQPNHVFWYYHHEYTVGMATRPLYLINGNASFYLGSEVYTEETGISLDPYKVVERGIRFIFLHTTGVQTPAGSSNPTDNHQCLVGEKAMDWLREELSADTNSTTFVFFHAPIEDTTYDSTERMSMVESEEMRILLGSHPNVKIIANGHTHYPYGATDGSGRANYKMEGDLLNICVGRPPNTMFINIEQDKIEIRIRDNQAKQWHTQFGYVYDVETSLQ
ncbi:MAG: hypothetical protein DRP64_21070, partial [Verrucomicrobia bacterium]